MNALAHSLPPLEGIPAGARVVVAMSGGVDSSVVAALLHQQGYDVIGITLQLYDQGAAAARKGSCCAGQDVLDARRVADAIGIPHYVFDYESRFRSDVIEPFAASYLAGETPIPCIACNQTVKFRDLLATARELGAAALATGHYAELRHTAHGPELYRAADADRDQSYFLFATTRQQLDFLRFPIGALAKAQVRQLAADFALPVAAKPDSQDICFVPSGRYGDLIEKLRPDAVEPGEIVHVDGRILGRHRGIVHFTVGQRRGLGLPGGSPPVFVVAVDAPSRRVLVGPRESLHTPEIMVKTANWFGFEPDWDSLAGGKAVHVRVRSSQPPRPATLFTQSDGIRVRLSEAEYGIAAGQACVFYADGGARARVLGGGFIAAHPNNNLARFPMPASGQSEQAPRESLAQPST